MRLIGGPAGARVTVTPDVIRPRQTVHATVTVDAPVDRVSSASLEWGYTNFYRYHWAGRRDAALSAANDAVWMFDQVCTNYGGERDTEDWVGITKIELPVTAGELADGSAGFRVPSWAPGSSSLIARWSCRLVVQRGGRDIDTRGDFTVLVGSEDVQVGRSPAERAAGSGETDIDIGVPTTVYRAGENIQGRLTLTPTVDTPDGDISLCLQCHRASHPLARTPADADVFQGDTLRLDNRVPLRNGKQVVLPFALRVPGDAAPTATGVHSSLSWFIAVQMSYAGLRTSTERLRLPIVVVNAP